MFKTRIGFYDNHAMGQMAERSAIFTLLIKTTANKSAKSPFAALGNDKIGSIARVRNFRIPIECLTFEGHKTLLEAPV